MRMNVPFLDLKAQYATIREEIADALQEVLDNTSFAGGPPVAEKCAREFVSLPMFPELTEEQVRYVVEKIKGLI